jgi:hypothetical protein
MVLVDVQTSTLHIGLLENKEVVVVTQVKHYINGKQVSGRNGRTSSVFNPATGEKTGLVRSRTPRTSRMLSLRQQELRRAGRRRLPCGEPGY